MSATVAQLRAVVSLDDRDLQRGVRRSEQAFGRLEGSAKRAGNAITNDLDKAMRVLGGGGALRGLTEAFTGLGSTAGNALRGLLGHFRSLASSVFSLAGSIASSLTQALIGATKAATGLALALTGGIAAGLAMVARTGLDMNLTLRGAQAGLTAITGSAEEAAKTVAELRVAAMKMSPTFKELLGQGVGLAAAYGPGGLGRVLPTLKAFDAAQKILQGSTENTKNALLQFRQMLARGALQGEELNGMEENLAGAGIRQMLQKKFGSSDPETLTQAGITGRQVADAIVDGFLKRFGEANGSLSAGLPVLLSGFLDLGNEVTGKITAKFLPQLEAAVSKALDAFSALANNESIIRALTVPFELLGKAADWAAGQLPKVSEWFERFLTSENVVSALAGVAGWFQTMGQEVQRFISTAAGEKGLAGVFSSFSGAAETAIDAVLRSFNVLASTVRFFIDHSAELWQIFADAMQPAQRALARIMHVVPETRTFWFVKTAENRES